MLDINLLGKVCILIHSVVKTIEHTHLMIERVEVFIQWFEIVESIMMLIAQNQYLNKTSQILIFADSMFKITTHTSK